MIDGFRRLTELVGEHAVYRLMSLHGGTRVYIPSPEHCSERHYLAVAIGLEALLRLAKEFGGDRVEVPVGLASIKKLRNEEIIAKADAGIKQSELALQYGMTERQIRNVLASRDAKVDENQMDLFS